MAGDFEIKIDGISNVVANLSAFPDKIVAGAFQDALENASVVVMREVVRKTPVNLNVRHRGGIVKINLRPLVASIMNNVVVDARLRGGYAEIGFGKMGFIARWLEYGCIHTGHEPDKKQGVLITKHVGFMRQALAESFDGVLEALYKSLVDWFAKGTKAA